MTDAALLMTEAPRSPQWRRYTTAARVRVAEQASLTSSGCGRAQTSAIVRVTVPPLGRPHKINNGEPCALSKKPAAEDRLCAHDRCVIAAFRSAHCRRWITDYGAERHDLRQRRWHVRLRTGAGGSHPLRTLDIGPHRSACARGSIGGALCAPSGPRPRCRPAATLRLYGLECIGIDAAPDPSLSSDCADSHTRRPIP
jgi:hypothetical protein